MVIVYEHPLSPYAQKVKIALREKKVPFEARLPGGVGAGGAAGEFVEANPRAEVPALIDGDVRVFDSTIILEYIEDKWPTPPLLPKTPAERARVRMIEEAFDTHYEAINWGLGEIAWFKRAEGELAKRIKANAAEQTAKWLAWAEKQLGDREWMNGDYFGWGDLSVAPYVAGSIGYGLGPEKNSKLGQWFSRAAQRPSIALCMEEAKAVRSNMVDVAGAVKAGLFRREYRDHRLEWMIKSGGIDVVVKGLEADNIRFTPEFQ